jgi:hypothetical protein
MKKRESQEKNDVTALRGCTHYRRTVRLVGWLIGIAGMGLGTFPSQGEIIDKIVAVLGNDLILFSEVQEYAQQPVVQVVAHLEDNPEIEQDTLNYLLERQLLFQEMHYLPLPRDIEAVQTLAVRYIVATYYADNLAAFTANVQAHGIDAHTLADELAPYMQGLEYIRRKNRFQENGADPDGILRLFRAWLAELQAQTMIQRFN